MFHAIISVTAISHPLCLCHFLAPLFLTLLNTDFIETSPIIENEEDDKGTPSLATIRCRSVARFSKTPQVDNETNPNAL